MGQGTLALGAFREAVRLISADLQTQIAALRLAHRLEEGAALVLHGEALLALSFERWLSLGEAKSSLLRNADALRNPVLQARALR